MFDLFLQARCPKRFKTSLYECCHQCLCRSNNFRGSIRTGYAVHTVYYSTTYCTSAATLSQSPCEVDVWNYRTLPQNPTQTFTALWVGKLITLPLTTLFKFVMNKYFP